MPTLSLLLLLRCIMLALRRKILLRALPFRFIGTRNILPQMEALKIISRILLIAIVNILTFRLVNWIKVRTTLRIRELVRSWVITLAPLTLATNPMKMTFRNRRHILLLGLSPLTHLMVKWLPQMKKDTLLVRGVHLSLKIRTGKVLRMERLRVIRFPLFVGNRLNFMTRVIGLSLTLIGVLVLRKKVTCPITFTLFRLIIRMKVRLFVTIASFPMNGLVLRVAIMVTRLFPCVTCGPFRVRRLRSDLLYSPAPSIVL